MGYRFVATQIPTCRTLFRFASLNIFPCLISALPLPGLLQTTPFAAIEITWIQIWCNLQRLWTRSYVLIKTVDDWYEGGAKTAPQVKVGLGFNDSCGAWLIRSDGND